MAILPKTETPSQVTIYLLIGSVAIKNGAISIKTTLG
jgi:hypothetical protein